MYFCQENIEWSGSGVEQKSGISHLFNLSKIDCAGFWFSVIWDPKGVPCEVWWVPFLVPNILFKSIWLWCDHLSIIILCDRHTQEKGKKIDLSIITIHACSSLPKMTYDHDFTKVQEKPPSPYYFAKVIKKWQNKKSKKELDYGIFERKCHV